MNTFIRRLAADIPLLMDSALAFLVGRIPGVDEVELAEHPAFKRVRESMTPKIEMNGHVAVVPITGPLAYNPDPFEMIFDGVEDSRSVLRMVNDVTNDSGVKGVLLRMDTPGGMMLGGPEMADAVAACKRKKPIMAHIGGLGASLGYMIASQANEIIANKSAIVGSIGVIASVTDYTALLSRLGIKFEVFTNREAKYKGAGSLGTSLTADQRDNIQQTVESAFGVFKSTVLSARPWVKTETMQGQTFRGTEAKTVGLVDRIGDENFAMGCLRKRMAA
jgi:signal peptide peptidase SppA